MNSQNKLFLCIAMSTLFQATFAAEPANDGTKKAAEAAPAAGALTPRSQRLYDQNKSMYPKMTDEENHRRIPILKAMEDHFKAKRAEVAADPGRAEEIKRNYAHLEEDLYNALSTTH